MDVQVTGDPSSAKKDYPRTPMRPAPRASPSVAPAQGKNDFASPSPVSTPPPTIGSSGNTGTPPSPSPVPKCTKKWRSCSTTSDCEAGPCSGLELVCGSYFGSSFMCVENGPHVQPTGCVLEWSPCEITFGSDGGRIDPCCPGRVCKSFQGSSPMCIS